MMVVSKDTHVLAI